VDVSPASLSNVTFEDHVNQVGVAQQACTLCGDCVSGCNYGAKNTVLMNYLPDARNHGAEIFTRVAVRFLERKDDRWLVHYQLLDSGRERFDAPPLFLSADIVVPAAGALGSTEIMLRSAANGLPLSEHVGQRMTGNGDVLAFSYNSDHEVDGVGWGHRDKGDLGPVGPCITGFIDKRDESELDQGMVIEEGSIPGALAAFLPHSMAAAARSVGVDTGPASRTGSRRSAESWKAWSRVPIEVQSATLRPTSSWPTTTATAQPSSRTIGCASTGPKWALNPFRKDQHNVGTRYRGAGWHISAITDLDRIWTEVLGHRLVTVHPLGGCVMAEDAERGVVNHKGQVFAGPRGSAVHRACTCPTAP
jgi:cholesterol oxidase